MNTDFATAMRRALESTRAMNPAEATATIQAALAGSSDAPVPEGAASRPPRTRFSLIDPAADAAEIVDEDRPRTVRMDARAPAPRPAPIPRRPFSVVDPKASLAAAGGATPQPGWTGAGAHMGRSLRDAVASLSLGRPGGLALDLPGMKPPSPLPAIPDGARYEPRTFSSREGTRDYRLYVPSGLTEEPQGLVVMLHGCTQNPDDFANGTTMNAHAERHGLLVAYPAQTGAHNAASCWNWFRPGDQRRDAGEPAIIAGITRALIAEFGVDPSRVYAAGLSAGGAMAAVLGEAYPDLYAAIGVHSGLPHGAASDVASAFSAMRGEAAGSRTPAARPAGGHTLRTIVFHGSADGTVHPSNADRIIAAAQAGAGGAAVSREAGTAPGGRGYRRTVVAGAKGSPHAELWLVEGLGHAWSGGAPAGSYTDPAGPDASAEMVRFFLNLA